MQLILHALMVLIILVAGFYAEGAGTCPTSNTRSLPTNATITELEQLIHFCRQPDGANCDQFNDTCYLCLSLIYRMNALVYSPNADRTTRLARLWGSHGGAVGDNFMGCDTSRRAEQKTETSVGEAKKKVQKRAPASNQDKK